MPVYNIRTTTPEERAIAADANRNRYANVTAVVNGRVYQTNLNLFSFLGCFPGIGIITGLFRLIIGMVTLCVRPNWASLQILRGTLEICCLGILFLPFDLGWLKFERVPD
jgi:hypothetical protein